MAEHVWVREERAGLKHRYWCPTEKNRNENAQHSQPFCVKFWKVWQSHIMTVPSIKVRSSLLDIHATCGTAHVWKAANVSAFFMEFTKHRRDRTLVGSLYYNFKSFHGTNNNMSQLSSSAHVFYFANRDEMWCDSQTNWKLECNLKKKSSLRTHSKLWRPYQVFDNEVISLKRSYIFIIFHSL